MCGVFADKRALPCDGCRWSAPSVGHGNNSDAADIESCNASVNIPGSFNSCISKPLPVSLVAHSRSYTLPTLSMTASIVLTADVSFAKQILRALHVTLAKVLGT